MPGNARDDILGALRDARRPFPNAAPRPDAFLPVTVQEARDPEALLERFCLELTALRGEPVVVQSDEEACARVVAQLQAFGATRVLAWAFEHIPVVGLQAALAEAGIEIIHVHTQDEFRAETLAYAETAGAGLTGADAAIATTGTLALTTGPGRGRLPSALPPLHIAVITLDQLLPTLEDWVKRLRADRFEAIRRAGNFCLITGPSRTGDIEMQLVLGVHGPGRIQVIIKR